MNNHTNNVISVEPAKLHHYATRALEIERSLLAEANRLDNILQHFEAACREQEFRLRQGSPLADDLRTYVRQAEAMDYWVYTVAQAFEHADASQPPSTLTMAESEATESGHSRAHIDVGLDNVVAQGTPATIVPEHGVVLLQSAPQGDEETLNTIRYREGQEFEVGAISHNRITTVRDHIREYGCLLTSYAMLLNDLGEQVAVTDLYKANYTAHTGHAFPIDAIHGAISLDDINAHPKMVELALQGRYHSLSATLGENPIETLHQLLSQVGGSVTIQTQLNGNEHWIVVDEKNGDGTFNIRDPVYGSRSHIHLGSDNVSDYYISSIGKYSYITNSA